MIDMNPQVTLASAYLADKIVVACARLIAEVQWRKLWHCGTNEVDLIGVVWGAMKEATDTQREAELTRAIKVVRKLGLVASRNRLLVLTSIDTSAEVVAEGIAHELRSQHTSEAMKRTIAADFAMPALLGWSVAMLDARWSCLEGKHLRLGYLAGQERAMRAEDFA